MGNILMNVLIGSLFIMFFYQIYKGRNKGLGGGAGGAGKTGKTGVNKD